MQFIARHDAKKFVQGRTRSSKMSNVITQVEEISDGDDSDSIPPSKF